MKSIDENLVKKGKGDVFRPMSGPASGTCYKVQPSPRQVRRKLERLRKAELRKQLKKKQ
tara:strand:+ start:76 stop:252 length:177 start_codon:yes stop_codon:yes gene_type:complete